MKIKVAEATGPVLDWLVAKCEGRTYRYFTTHGGDYNGWTTGPHYLHYSTDWSQGGPILTEAKISRTIDHSGLWIAYDGFNYADAKEHMQCDRSELVAGLRCFVASKLGDEVEVSDELTS